MIAVDTNVLVYAHRGESALHDAARAAVAELAEGHRVWAIPWPCIDEFLSVVTHPRVFSRRARSPRRSTSSTLGSAHRSRTVSENDRFLDYLRALAVGGAVAGPRLHDARIAAICLANGVTELWSADRDFGRFPSLRVRNPLVA